MALLWIDGFDHYVSTGTSVSSITMTGAYAVVNDWVGNQIETFSGGSSLSLSTNIDDRDITGAVVLKELPSSKSSGSVGVGFNFLTRTLEDNPPILGWHSGTGDSQRDYIVYVNTSGQLVLRSNDTDLFTTSSSAISADSAAHIEGKLVIAGSGAGSVEVRVDGITVLLHTGITTNTNSITHIGLHPRRTSGFNAESVDISWFDNLYVWDDSGSVNNDWFGPRIVETIMPNMDTATADWTLSTGTDGFGLIDNIPQLSSTEYLEASAATNESIFDLEALSSSDITIAGIQTMVLAEKTGTTATSMTFGPTNDVSDAVDLTQSVYEYFSDISETNPSTGLAWTSGEIDSLQISIKRTV